MHLRTTAFKTIKQGCASAMRGSKSHPLPASSTLHSPPFFTLYFTITHTQSLPESRPHPKKTQEGPSRYKSCLSAYNGKVSCRKCVYLKVSFLYFLCRPRHNSCERETWNHRNTRTISGQAAVSSFETSLSSAVGLRNKVG